MNKLDACFYVGNGCQTVIDVQALLYRGQGNWFIASTEFAGRLMQAESCTTGRRSCAEQMDSHSVKYSFFAVA